MFKTTLAATCIALFALSSPAAFAQSDSDSDTMVQSGDAAGNDKAQTTAYAVAAGVSAAALIGAAFAVANSGSDDSVDLGGGSTGTTGPGGGAGGTTGGGATGTTGTN